MKRWWFSLMVALAVVGLVAGGVPRAQAGSDRVGTPAYRNEVLGVSLRTLPPETRIVEDQYLSDAFGFTLVAPDGRMVLRVAWRHHDTPDQIAQRARELVRGFPGLNLQIQPVSVNSRQGIMVTGMPGMDPSLYVYVAANGKLYEIICPQREEGGRDCGTLLELLSFGPATRSLEELRLIRAEDALYEKPPFLESPSLKGLGFHQGEAPHTDSGGGYYETIGKYQRMSW